jgi:5-methyltetrahydrofolate--homocysteine methyltransferase
MNRTIFDLIKERAVLFDGGMGTELMRYGLPLGTCPETWNVERPDIVQRIHASYFEAGSDVVSTNSFGGNGIKLAAHGLEGRVRELNSAAARVARRAAPAGKFVAGSMGPTGKFLQPQGEFTESEFEEAYGEQAGALAEGGVDLLIIETQYDLKEALAALKGARRAAPSLPVFVTLTFNKFPRGYFTLMGNTVALSVEALEREGTRAVGANCTLNSEDMVGLIRAFREATKLPVIAQANAGKPALSGDGQVSYSQGLEDYVRFIPEMLKAGANVIGGCCGTDPGYIRKMAEFILK